MLLYLYYDDTAIDVNSSALKDGTFLHNPNTVHTVNTNTKYICLGWQ
jgi:hypothetical protein